MSYMIGQTKFEIAKDVIAGLECGSGSNIGLDQIQYTCRDPKKPHLVGRKVPALGRYGVVFYFRILRGSSLQIAWQMQIKEPLSDAQIFQHFFCLNKYAKIEWLEKVCRIIRKNEPEERSCYVVSFEIDFDMAIIPWESRKYLCDLLEQNKVFKKNEAVYFRDIIPYSGGSKNSISFTNTISFNAPPKPVASFQNASQTFLPQSELKRKAEHAAALQGGYFQKPLLFPASEVQSNTVTSKPGNAAPNTALKNHAQQSTPHRSRRHAKTTGRHSSEKNKLHIQGSDLRVKLQSLDVATRNFLADVMQRIRDNPGSATLPSYRKFLYAKLQLIQSESLPYNEQGIKSIPYLGQEIWNILFDKEFMDLIGSSANNSLVFKTETNDIYEMRYNDFIASVQGLKQTIEALVPNLKEISSFPNPETYLRSLNLRPKDFDFIPIFGTILWEKVMKSSMQKTVVSSDKQLPQKVESKAEAEAQAISIHTASKNSHSEAPQHTGVPKDFQRVPEASEAPKHSEVPQQSEEPQLTSHPKPKSKFKLKASAPEFVFQEDKVAAEQQQVAHTSGNRPAFNLAAPEFVPSGTDQGIPQLQSQNLAVFTPLQPQVFSHTPSGMLQAPVQFPIPTFLPQYYSQQLSPQGVVYFNNSHVMEPVTQPGLSQQPQARKVNPLLGEIRKIPEGNRSAGNQPK